MKRIVRRLMIAAMSSGSGKTVMTCGLMRAFGRRGMTVEGYKCGPDYIDPMFHQSVLGVPSRNLDLYLQGEAGVTRTMQGQQAELAIVEGAMGFYDGLGGTTDASAWAVADTQGIPVVLVVRPGGSSLTLAAQILGVTRFRSPGHIAGILLTDCRPALYAHLEPILERETGLPVLGYLPPMEEANIPSRHLGLVTAAEIADLSMRFDVIAEALERHVDLEALLALAAEVEIESDGMNIRGYAGAGARNMVEPQGDSYDVHKNSNDAHSNSDDAHGRPLLTHECRMESQPVARRCRIAVAMDEAFSFYYQDNLDLLETAGAEIRFFSPLRDTALPEADGLYLGGGYPELHLAELSAQESMRVSVRDAIERGMPTVAECGGFLYLQQALRDERGNVWPMAGALPGIGYRTDRLQRFGYLMLTGEDSMLLRTGERVPAHEFHYWDCTDCGTDLVAQRSNGRSWRCGSVSETLYAAFPHFHWGGAIPMAERFVQAAVAYRERQDQNRTAIGTC